MLPINALKPIPESSLRRLPLYHRFLEELLPLGRKFVSTTEIAAALATDATLVRKDLESAGIAGRPKVGYEVQRLLSEIEAFLGWDRTQQAFLVGAGNLGAALLGYTRFARCGLRIISAFDKDPRKVGRRIGETEVLALEQLPELARQACVYIGIITAPAESAQQVAELMISGGIRAIWNFAPVFLRLPPEIIVRNEDLYCSLASLSQKLAEVIRREQLASHPQLSDTLVSLDGAQVAAEGQR